MGLEYVDMKKMPTVAKTIISEIPFLNTLIWIMEVVHCKNCTDWDQMCRTVAQSINY